MPPRLCFALLLFALPAHAVVIRGRVTTPLGAPLPGSRVQLISLSAGPRNAASTISGIDGDYEIRTSLGGRFLLLTAPSVTAPVYAPQIGTPFYAGRADLVIRDITLDTSAITPQLTTQGTLRPTPLAQLSSPVTQMAADQLLVESTPLPQIAAAPGAFLVQYGQTASPAVLYLRGAPVTRVQVDGVTAEPLGSPFNFGALTSSGLSAIASTPAIELTPAPDPLRFFDSQPGLVSLATAPAQTLRPAITYIGDAGNLSSTRNEAIVSATRIRADALASFARFNTDNDSPARPAHLITSSASLGYQISSATSLRLTARQDVTAAPLTLPFALFNLQPAGRQASQNLYSRFSFETRTAGNWHNLLAFGIARERSQLFSYATPLTGLPVTITGANGYSASGTATFPFTPPRQDFVTNRDEYTYLTDYPVRRTAHTSLAALLTVRYQSERAAYQQSSATGLTRTTLDRDHLSLAASLQGELRHRLFVQASGFFDDSSFLGSRGSPRFGLTYVPVRPGARRFRGTTLRVTAATGIREPGLSEQISTFSPAVPHARTLEFGVDQSLIAQKLILRSTYFHNQFTHASELIALSPATLSDTLAYRTQGLESSLRYQPFPRLLFTGAYTYLASLVQQSATLPTFNPGLPGVPIGALSALPGARPFHRPPHTGSFAVQFTGTAFTAAFRANLASRSDDSTSTPQNPNLLLPNRDLSPGYVALDCSAGYAVSHSITVFTQLSNLLNDRNIAPIGYLSTPFQFRAGLRIRLGGE